MASKPFSKNVVVLTGASSGIGRELALQLAQQGAMLALASRNVEQLHEVAELCHQRGGTAVVVPTDVSEQSQCCNLVEQTLGSAREHEADAMPVEDCAQLIIEAAGQRVWCRRKGTGDINE